LDLPYPFPKLHLKKLIKVFFPILYNPRPGRVLEVLILSTIKVNFLYPNDVSISPVIF
jgi:hypothetical protein